MSDISKLNVWDDSRLRGYLGAINRRCGVVETLALPTMRDLPPVKIETLFVPPLLSTEAVDADIQPEDWPQGKSLFEEIETSPRLVVLGDPGGGKTTLSNWVAWRLTSGLASPLPARLANVIPLTCVLREMPADFLKEECNINGLATYLARKLLGEAKSESVEPVLHEWIACGKFILILDGIDEIPVQSRAAVAKWIREAREKDACVLATSRIIGYQDFPVDSPVVDGASRKEKKDLFIKRLLKPLAEPASEVEKVSGAWAEIRYLMPFDKGQISDFVRNWYRQRCTSDGEAKSRTLDLLGALNDSSVTSKLARTPNLLSLMAVVHRERAHLPDGKALLYEEIVNAYLNTIDSQRKILQYDALGNHTWRDKKSWLSYVGFMMQSTRLSYSQEGILVSEKKVISWLVKAMRKSKVSNPEAMAVEFLAWVARRSGLLLPRGEGFYAFVHLSFQEYFCACYIETAVVSPDFFNSNNRTNSAVTPELVSEWAMKSSWLETLIFVFEILSNERNDCWVNSLVRSLFPAYPKYSPVQGSIGFLAARLLTNKHVKLERGWVEYLADISCLMVHGVASDPLTNGVINSFAALGFAYIVNDVEGEFIEGEVRNLSVRDGFDLSNVRILIVRSTAKVTADFISKFERIFVIDCEGTDSVDLSGCCSKYISVISVQDSALRGCEVISGFKRLETLNLVSVDQSGLELCNGSLNVQNVIFCDVNLASIKFVEGWKKLDNIDLTRLNFADFSPLKSAKKLTYLSLDRCSALSDVEFLSSLKNLQYLSIHNCPVEFIPILKCQVPLSIGLMGLQIKDFSFLSKLSFFGGGMIEDCPITTLEGLKSTANYLHLTNLPLNSLEGLQNFASLRSMALQSIDVSDLTPVSKLKNLTTVKLDDVPVSDFNWITGLNKLTTLLFSRTKIKDITPLLRLKSLHEVYVSEAEGLDFSALEDKSKISIWRSDEYFG
ncbi:MULTISPECIES: NACHT domain-containing protein [Pseudomonas]|uniref:NACHT domain-containing protein n=1 Tax=Pseudomonas TaxID=286 RepID=UPI0021F84FA0|nr:NACHT domain-containing protein [Pseudomonas putida]